MISLKQSLDCDPSRFVGCLRVIKPQLLVIKAAVIFNKEQHAYHSDKKVTEGQQDRNKTTEKRREGAAVGPCFYFG